MLGIGIGVPFSVQSLIAQIQATFVGKTGYWGRPILLSSLFQDSAGTTPVTAVEQPVGRVLDQSGSGNHATQATAAARPGLSSRVNLLTKSEQFDDAVWTKSLLTTAPYGGDGTYKLTTTAVGDANIGEQINTGGAIGGKTVTCSITLHTDAGQPTDVILFLYDMAVAFVYTRPLTLTTTPTRYVFTQTIDAAAAGSNLNVRVDLTEGTSGAYVYAKAAQLETGSAATRYQRVNTATDYDTAGFPNYLSFDGIDDSMSSATGGGGTAGFFFCAAVRVTGGAGVFRRLFSDLTTAMSGYILSVNSTNKLQLTAGDGAAFTAIASTDDVPVGSLVLITAYDDGSQLSVQVNKGAVAQVARPAVASGGSSFTIGKNNEAATVFLPGNLYSPIYVRNSGLTAPERLSIQRQVAAEAGITL